MKSLILPILVLINLNLLAQKQEIDQPYQKGMGENGVRVGEWKYFGINEELELTYNYDSYTVSYLKLDTSLYLIYDNDDWKAVKPDRQLRYIGSYNHLYNFFAKELSSTYSSKASKKKISTILLLELEFSEEGQLVEKKIIGEDKEYFEEAILTIAESIPEYWIPAIYNGIPVKSKISFPIIYTRESKEDKQPKIEDLNYVGKVMSPIKVVGYGF
ncbi:hypothetical protein QYS49_15310 [Marivirga salinae]|uniref:TonB C-terminal domain-containing protein n=1 Tax=Marivirga salinarum TaxID=3059078 RepID=A0AA49GEX3_9BACT|nr:hypothetical protein [Marivirga sp. BDSF4-3]WKK78276.2 hypothetical protein QYS49_15310 [Marivirga sp. BDSF4-3]